MLIQYFPNPFSMADYNSIISDENEDFDLFKLGFNTKYQFVESATHGIYLLLSSFNLQPGSKVGLPPLICNSVTLAILKAGFKPYYFDINNNLNSDYFLIPDSFGGSSKFKYVFKINSDAKKSSAFLSLMKENGIEIHNCSSTDSVHTQNLQLLNSNKLKNNLFELSTEAGIPEENFNEAAKIMNDHISYL
ncbi:MAG TPA: hypothetical protein DHV28_00940 [Ignavibacteriales bacterium]|nr:hypothetical protein [Ignavibacteriales bacterium]